ncbi:MAG: hypothetical protein HC901_04055 [Bdellovibrionaceae bacterium]|nr:hypothetical protein [Pseudobdellovibrionaceae bacterium]
MVTYNLGECFFLKGEYAKAQENFKIFVNKTPNAYIHDLVRYKIYITHLKLSQTEDARRMLATLEATPLSPVFYYAHAAERFSRGDADGGYKWLTDGIPIYADKQNKDFMESLLNLGWITEEKVAWEMAQRREERAADLMDTVDVIKDLRAPEQVPSKGLLE